MPNLGAIKTGGHERSAVATEEDLIHVLGMSAQGEDLFSGGGVPEFHGFVPARGSEPAAVRAVRQIQNRSDMAQKRLREFPRDRIPHSYDSVVAAAGQMPAVWSKGHALDTALVLAEGADFPAGSRIEEDDILVVSPDSHSELSATRLVGYAAD